MELTANWRKKNRPVKLENRLIENPIEEHRRKKKDWKKLTEHQAVWETGAEKKSTIFKIFPNLVTNVSVEVWEP